MTNSFTCVCVSLVNFYFNLKVCTLTPYTDVTNQGFHFNQFYVSTTGTSCIDTAPGKTTATEVPPTGVRKRPAASNVAPAAKAAKENANGKADLARQCLAAPHGKAGKGKAAAEAKPSAQPNTLRKDYYQSDADRLQNRCKNRLHDPAAKPGPKAKSDAKPAKDKAAEPMAAAATAPAALTDHQLEPTHGPLAGASTQLIKENNNEKDESPDKPAEDEPPDDTRPSDDLVDGDEVMPMQHPVT